MKYPAAAAGPGERASFRGMSPNLKIPSPSRGGNFMGFSHFHGRFSNPSPFKGEGRRGMGYICRCSIKEIE
jgi:hypothetical protein